MTCVMALAVCAVGGQEPPQTFRTATRLVEVPVVVTDRAGKLVRGLSRTDFAITEDGVAQTIAFLEVVDTRKAAPPDEDLPVVSAPGMRGAFSNRVAEAATGASLVIVLDRMNAAFDSQWFARRDVDRYLSRMAPGDRVALYVLDGAMRVLHDFTTDKASLRRALDTYQARVSGVDVASTEPLPEPPPGRDAIPVWIADPAAAPQEFFTRARWRNTFGSLRVLAQHLVGVTGRKSVVWVSEAFRIPSSPDRAEFLEEMRRTTRAMSDAQVALYPVDARGLVGAMTFSPRRTSFTTLASVRGNIETMEIMAEETGGRAFANTNALDASIGRAADDGRVTYLLAYEPSKLQADGRFRRITVKVNRRDVVVRHRGGYVASAPATDRKSRDAALREALSGPLTASRIGLAADTDYDRVSGRLAIDVRIDPTTLSLERGSSWLSSVDVIVAEVSRGGLGTIAHTERVDVEISDDVRAEVFREGVLVRFDVPVSPKLHQLRIIARDVASGHLGSLVIPGSEALR